MTPDVNVLVAASRSDHPHHAVASAWLQGALAACATGASLRLLPLVVASFLRLVTHPRIFPDATPIDQAVAFVDALLAQPGVDMPAVGSEWPLMRQLCLDRQITANDVPDAWLASAVLQWRGHLVTFDKGFARWLRPQQLTLLRV